jgi:Domain of unknown function (DUF4337)
LVDETEIPEAAQHHLHGAEHGPDGFRRVAAIYVGVVAMLLAISSLGGGQATKQMLGASIRASDTYSFAQAKYLRQTAYELAADQLEAQFVAYPSISDEAKAAMTALIAKYRAAAERYASDPKSGEGRRELLATAKDWDAVRDHAEAQDPNFQFAAALFQIAIVLASVAIAAVSRPLLVLSAVSAGCATLLTINGFFLFVHAWGG